MGSPSAGASTGNLPMETAGVGLPVFSSGKDFAQDEIPGSLLLVDHHNLVVTMGTT